MGFFNVPVDLYLGSSDGGTDRKDFVRTYKVDHLALLGTSSSVSSEFIILV